MQKMIFVAWLYVAAACCFFACGPEIYQKANLWLTGQNGTMRSIDPEVARYLKFGDPKSTVCVDVIYVTATEQVQVVDKYVSYQELERLSRAEEIPVRFSKSNLHWVLFDHQTLEIAWGWPVAGLVLFVFAIFAHRLLKREAVASARRARNG
jgi:hypothetical protein